MRLSHLARTIRDMWAREPALCFGVINAALVVIFTFVPLSDTRQAALFALAAALAAVGTRSQVTPARPARDPPGPGAGPQ